MAVCVGCPSSALFSRSLSLVSGVREIACGLGFVIIVALKASERPLSGFLRSCGEEIPTMSVHTSSAGRIRADDAVQPPLVHGPGQLLRERWRREWGAVA